MYIWLIERGGGVYVGKKIFCVRGQQVAEGLRGEVTI